ncbi:unnamed protein product [Linum trigynum]|uniref:Uncharacterized protein n=1 Tax=Linum trigynum TaxID=586398 RepID=A0AAV2CFV0_9ROSI
MTVSVPGGPLPDPRPPEINAGSTRPPDTSSSPNGKSERETQQAKKRPKAMCVNPLFVATPMAEDSVTPEESPVKNGNNGTNSPRRPATHTA